MNKILLSYIIFLFILTGCSSSLYTNSTENEYGTFSSYKVGTPYYIGHVRYQPKALTYYDQIGIASWYGPKFNGHKLAAGGIFNMNKISAAHKTLPLPSMVLVTNLKNGRTLKVLVNDRGPYKKNRIIDLSKRAAEILGYAHQGTTRIRVQLLPYETHILQIAAKRNNERIIQRVPTWLIHHEPYSGLFMIPVAQTLPSFNPHMIHKLTGYYIQIAAYTSLHQAEKIQKKFSHAMIFQRHKLYKVLIGPFDTQTQANIYLSVLEKQHNTISSPLLVEVNHVY